MIMTKVQSIIIDAVGHEGDTLHVRFTSGDTYRYWPVSDKEYDDMLQADSIGGHFTRTIKNQKEYEKEGDNEQ